MTLNIPSNSGGGILVIAPCVGSKRLTATVMSLSQIAQVFLPSMLVLSLKALAIPVCSLVEHGTMRVVPNSVDFGDRMTTGLHFHISGRCASLGRLHQ